MAKAKHRYRGEDLSELLLILLLRKEGSHG
jgi:hypothetical protein